MDEFEQSMEEAFVERNFEYGNEPDISMANLESSLNVYFRSNKECSIFAEQICDGEVTDTPSVILSLQNLIYSHKYEERFKNELGGKGPIIDLASIDISRTASLLASEGTALVVGAKQTLNIENMEKGKFLLFVAMNS